jgi:DNA-binding MarR family transcriptional regulator
MSRNGDTCVGNTYLCLHLSARANYNEAMSDDRTNSLPGPGGLEAPFPPAARARQKWGEGIVAGFQQVPDLLLKHQSKLGLSATDLAVLRNVTMHWWYPEQNPFPRATTIAKRMGVSTRTVERCLLKLRKKGFVHRTLSTGQPRRTELDLGGLVKKLEELAVHDVSYQRRVANQRSIVQIPRLEGPNLRPASDVPF